HQWAQRINQLEPACQQRRARGRKVVIPHVESSQGRTTRSPRRARGLEQRVALLQDTVIVSPHRAESRRPRNQQLIEEPSAPARTNGASAATRWLSSVAR